jgi:predicted RNA-binding Zn ribbon-like protein
MDLLAHGTGERLCLDFANTASARDTDAPKEHLLHTYGDLLAWSEAKEALPPAIVARLAERAERRPEDAAAALGHAIALREALYRIFTAHALSEPPQDRDLVLLNNVLARAMPHRRLEAVQAEFRWQWDEEAADLDRVLWPIAQSAAELLTSPELDRVRECAKEHCNWLFVDRSKNRSRRWCDMQECGNVAKVRRYRSRKQAAAE